MSSREEFEASPRFKGMDFTRSVTHPEYYESPYANGSWDGWQAAKLQQQDLLSALLAITNSGPDAIPIKEAFEMAHRAIERAIGANV